MLQEIVTSVRRLPHWRLGDAFYFVTWRVAPGRNDLSDVERDIVVGALRFFDGVRYDLLSAIVMNDHVHVVVAMRPGHSLSKALHSWKSFSAHRINDEAERTGPVWLGEHYDRLIRDDDELKATIAHVEGNARKRWPAIAAYRWMVRSNDVIARALGLAATAL
ncbi:MAG TPA: transposase [Myxococcota bacterium]